MPEDTRKPLDCPRCGREMNRHAEKIAAHAVREDGREDSSEDVLYEFHTCAPCRFVLERPSA